MSQASTVRPTRPGHFLLGRRFLLTAGAAMGLLLGTSAAAQQYDSIGSSVIVDYGVLDGLGNPSGPNLPGMLGGGQPPAAPYGGAYAHPGTPYGGQGILLQPPAATPRSGLTVPGEPGSGGAIKLIPPSEFKNKNRTAAVPPAKPAAPPPAAEPTPPRATESSPPPTPLQEVEPAPPPPPTEIDAPAPPSPQPGNAAATPEPPAMAQVSPAVAIVPGEEAAAEPAPVPGAESVPPPSSQAPATDEAAAAATVDGDYGAATPVSGGSDVDEVPPPPESEAMAETIEVADQVAPEQAATGMGASETAATEMAATEESQAALPAPAMVEGQVSVTFAEGASELTPEGRKALDTVADRLREDESLRVQLLAYAKAIDDNTSRARRMSLSRALAVRSYLIEKGVRSTRMDVRALGSSVENEPADRVDVIPQSQ